MIDARAIKICRQLMTQGVSRRKIDRGVRYTNYIGKRPKLDVKPKTKGDRILQPQECYAAAITSAHNDAIQYARLRLKHKANPTFRNWRKLIQVQKKISGQGELGKFKIELPWLFTDFNPNTTYDDGLLIQGLQTINKMSNRNGLALARGLFAFATKPKAKGGFGIRYIPFSTILKPTINKFQPTAVEAIRLGYGDCTPPNIYSLWPKLTSIQVKP